MKNITLGKYVPGKTLIHKLDSRVKLLVLFALLVSIFFNLSFYHYLGLVVIVAIMMIISKTSIKSVFSSLKAMWIMIFILFIINIFVVKTGDILFTIGKFELYSGSLIQTFQIFIRLYLMVCLTSILTTTTTPLELTYAIEFYFTPLKVIKFPAHEIAMTISIALRFIPTLLEETERIMKAQASRGVDMGQGKLREKITGVISLIIPLFVSSFQRSEELANAMEARGYNPDAKRTRYRQLKFHLRDLFVFLLISGLVFITIYSSYKYPYSIIEFIDWIKNLW